MVRKVVVGVTGGIAAYKSVELVRLLQKQQCEVKATTDGQCLPFYPAFDISSFDRPYGDYFDVFRDAST